MNAQLLDTLIALLIRRGLTWLGVGVGSAAGVTDDWIMQTATIVGSVALIAMNEIYQAVKLHQTQKLQGGVMPPAK